MSKNVNTIREFQSAVLSMEPGETVQDVLARTDPAAAASRLPEIERRAYNQARSSTEEVVEEAARTILRREIGI